MQGNPSYQYAEECEERCEREGFSQRLQAAMQSQTINRFAKNCGISESLIRKYLLGLSQPGLEKLATIARETNTSLDWLITGTGAPGSPVAPETAEEFLPLPCWDPPRAEREENHSHTCWGVSLCAHPHWLIRRGLDGRNLGMVTARGDAMAPTIGDGDLLLVDRSQAELRAGIFALESEGYQIIRRIQRDVAGGIRLQTDNPAYENSHMDEEMFKDVALLGRVVFRGSPL